MTFFILPNVGSGRLGLLPHHQQRFPLPFLFLSPSCVRRSAESELLPSFCPSLTASPSRYLRSSLIVPSATLSLDFDPALFPSRPTQRYQLPQSFASLRFCTPLGVGPILDVSLFSFWTVASPLPPIIRSSLFFSLRAIPPYLRFWDCSQNRQVPTFITTRISPLVPPLSYKFLVRSLRLSSLSPSRDAFAT